MTSPRVFHRKVRRGFWLVTTSVWLLLVGAYIPVVITVIEYNGFTKEWALAGIGLASSIIWFAGIRHLALWFISRQESRQGEAAPNLAPKAKSGPSRVALLYCTANDFNPDALRASMSQTSTVSSIILDDSSNVHIQNEIDRFAMDVGAEVIRRPSRTGFKAGNINYALAEILDRFDHFVIVDSDERLEPTFVERGIAHFYRDSSIGIVQGRHRAVPSGTRFSAAFAGLLESHISVVHQARARIGFSAFMGRGAIISAECFRAVGKMPEVVTEDVAFSLEARMQGYRVFYDNSLLSEEDFPVDYNAFRTQHAKTVEGTTEFILKNTKRIVRSRLHISEKADLIIEQLTAPLTGLAGLLLLASGLLAAASQDGTRQPPWALLATAVLGLAALFPETVRLAKNKNLLHAAFFLAGASALYASTLALTLVSAAKILFGGRAIFHVTPKRSQQKTLRLIFTQHRIELAASAIVLCLSFVVGETIIVALAIVGPTLAGLFFSGWDLFGTRLRASRRPLMQ